MDKGQRYKPPVFFSNRHLQVATSSSAIRRFCLRKRRKELEQTGTALLIETACQTKLTAILNRREVNQQRCLVILLHGWEGSAHSSYIISCASHLLANGFDTLRLNFRDHGGSHHLNKEIFNSSRHAELVAALHRIQQQHNYKHYALVGFSLGGNFALRIASESRLLPQKIDAVFSVCPVIDPKHTSEELSRGPSWYESYFVKKWKKSLLKKQACFPEYTYKKDLLPMKSLSEMNEYFIPRYTGYNTVDSYFRSYTLNNSLLNKIDSPVKILAAKDDPVIPISDFSTIEPSTLITLEKCAFGSHCAFLQNIAGPSWADEQAAQFLSEVLI